MDGIEVTERDQVARRHDDVIGHATVARDADRSGNEIPADVVLPPLAGEHRPHPSSSYTATTARARRTVTNLAHDLVAERDGQRGPAPPECSRARSVRQTPAASTRSSASPGPGSGRGRSTSSARPAPINR